MSSPREHSTLLSPSRSVHAQWKEGYAGFDPFHFSRQPAAFLPFTTSLPSGGKRDAMWQRSFLWMILFSFFLLNRQMNSFFPVASTRADISLRSVRRQSPPSFLFV